MPPQPSHAKISQAVEQPRDKKRKRQDANVRQHSQAQRTQRSLGGPRQKSSRSADSTESRKPKDGIRTASSTVSEPNRELPIWKHHSNICDALTSLDVLLLVGETGSGKSTQIPQMLAAEPFCTRCIAITQPRRVAAISLARRVAHELGSPPPGHPQAKVGYSVRFDQKVGPKTRIKFLTEGMLLQELQRDPELKEYSAVVVDEVHERSVNVDLILGFVKRLVHAGGDRKGSGKLKTVVMSATADVESLRDWFLEDWPGSLAVHVAATAAEQAQQKLDGHDGESVSASRSKSKASKDGKNRSKNVETKSIAEDKTGSDASAAPNVQQHVEIVRVEGRQYPVSVSFLPEATADFPEATVKTIFEIHYREALPGDILVFLTGQDVVESVEAAAKEYASVMEASVPKLWILPLFAALPQSAQQEVFEPTPPGHRKVVLATNIAETSVTIPGVRFVVDCGLAKVKEFRSQLGLDSLLVKPISKSSAIQRMGRAGREGPGKAYRLYTHEEYLKLEEAAAPEILRCDLASAILAIKARGIVDMHTFPFLTRPRPESLRKALLQLFRLGALAEDGQISDVGKQMARMPLTPPLARVMLQAAHGGTNVVLPVVDILSCLSVENVFLHLTSEEKMEEAQVKRRELYRREGDHLTLLATVQAYAGASDRKAWAREHYVSHRAMRNVMEVRKQLQELARRLGIAPAASSSASVSPEQQGIEVLRCFLRAFVGNTARLMPDGSYRTLEGNQTVAIHPSSVLFGRKTEAIMYHELVFTMKSYARGVSAVQLDWYGEAAASSSA